MTRPDEPWTTAAFGLGLSGDFLAPGLGAQAPRVLAEQRRWVALSLVTANGVELHRLESGATLLYANYVGGSRFTISWSPPKGFCLDHDYYGRFRVSVDGTEITCTPQELEDWQWQRFLVGQVLPLAAVQHGLEPLHASAVAIDGRAILCMGTSGAGKTSTALHMVAAGAAPMADDVTAVEVVGNEVLAHAGAGLASVDQEELVRLEGGSRLGPLRRLGLEHGEVRVVLESLHYEPAPVGGIYVLTRRDHVPALSFEPLGGSRAAVLLGATFNAYAQARERLISQLDVCARLAEDAPIWRVSVPLNAAADEVATAVIDRARAAA